jgi:murein hydrolase activator
MKTTPKTTLLLALTAELCVLSSSHANPTSLVKTQQQLTEIEKKMTEVKKNLTDSHSKQTDLNRQLISTEKQLLNAATELKHIQSALADKQTKINRLQQHVNRLTEQLASQQSLLVQHVITRYKLRTNNPPITWLFNQKKPETLTRMLMYYPYLIQARQQAMKAVLQTQQALTLNHQKLHQDMIDQKHLEHHLNQRQQTFDNNRRHHMQLVSALRQHIDSQEKKLQAYQRNKNALSHLLATLAQESVLQTKHSFSQMRHKLQKPISISHQNIKKLNQGIVFFSNEGSPVVAVYPGKVVFSDWLNGYGFLLIIDHGWGFMTLYANNTALLKPKGRIVNQGETIAIVGHSGTLKQNGLYFEIRQRGKAVNPLEWLS